MSTQVNVHEAKTHLSRLLERVEAGENVVIARDGKPVAQLTALTTKLGRRFGSAAGEFTIPPDFDAPIDDIIADFER